MDRGGKRKLRKGEGQEMRREKKSERKDEGGGKRRGK